MTTLSDFHATIRDAADPEKAAFYPTFFKTGPGEYGEGDKFLGVTVPNCRIVAKKFSQLSFEELDTLLKSRWHEERLTALIILVSQYKKAAALNRKTIYEFYLAHTHAINNWDLVDTSSYHIVGWHIYDNPNQLPMLDRLAMSGDLWERRIAMVSTFYFLKKTDPSVTLHIAETLVNDTHDLIQKAVGWMLREMGKRVDQQLLVEFLAHHHRTMPRTALRYAIEHFSPETRRAYLSGIV